MHLSKPYLLINELDYRIQFLLERVPEEFLLLELRDFIKFIDNHMNLIINEFKRNYYQELDAISTQVIILMNKYLNFAFDLDSLIEDAQLGNQVLLKLNSNIKMPSVEDVQINPEYAMSNLNRFLQNYFTVYLNIHQNKTELLSSEYWFYFTNNPDLIDKFLGITRQIQDKINYLNRSIELVEKSHPYYHYKTINAILELINIDYTDEKHTMMTETELYVNSVLTKQEHINYLSGVNSVRPPISPSGSSTIDKTIKNIKYITEQLVYNLHTRINEEIPAKIALHRYKQKKQIYEYEDSDILDDELSKAESYYNRELCLYLHDFGLNPVSEMTRGNIRTDIVGSESDENHQEKFNFIFELKVYKKITK